MHKNLMKYTCLQGVASVADVMFAILRISLLLHKSKVELRASIDDRYPGV